MKKFFWIMVFILGFIMTAPAQAASHQVKTYKGEVVTSKQKTKSKGMEDDRRRYNKWCKQHPGQCSKKLKMFD